MPVPLRLFDGPRELGAAVADHVWDRLAGTDPDRPFLLGCPGGRSPEPAYTQLAREAARRRLDLSRLVIVMMDEYVVSDHGDGWRPVDPELPHSCRGFGRRVIIEPINQALAAAGLPTAYGISDDRLWVPDPKEPEAYDQRLAAAGGLDVFLLASGSGDGHIAFNPPGADRDSTTRVVALPDSTRHDNLVTFPSFHDELAAVPDHGVSVGIATIRHHSAEVIMLAHGADKQKAVARMASAAAYEPDWPATIVVECHSPQLFVDRAALGQSTPSTSR